jgi:hypothetical protein
MHGESIHTEAFICLGNQRPAPASSSSGNHSPQLDIGLSNFSLYRSNIGYSHPAPASHFAQIVTPLGLRASYTTFTETQSPLQNSFTPAIVGSTADIASPLPLQHANTVCYVGDFSSLPGHLVMDPIPQRNSEHSSFHSSLSDLELVDQPRLRKGAMLILKCFSISL